MDTTAYLTLHTRGILKLCTFVCINTNNISMNGTNHSLSNQRRPYKSRIISPDTSKCLKTAENASKRIVRKINKEIETVDNPLNSTILTNALIKSYARLADYRRLHRLTPECMELLIYVCNLYKLNTVGYSGYSISKLFVRDKLVGSELTSVMVKIGTLVNKGLMLVVGKGDRGAYLYIPSVKAIEDIENIFK